MFIIATVVGLSIFVFAVGKIAKIKELWLFGFIFAIIILSELIMNFGYDGTCPKNPEERLGV